MIDHVIRFLLFLVTAFFVVMTTIYSQTGVELTLEGFINLWGYIRESFLTTFLYAMFAYGFWLMFISIGSNDTQHKEEKIEEVPLGWIQVIDSEQP